MTTTETDRTQRPKIKLGSFDFIAECTDEEGTWLSPLAIIYGFRRTGKSCKVVSLLHESRDKYGSAHRFSPTADLMQPDGTYVYGRIFAKACCWTYPTFDLLDKILEFQVYLTTCTPPGISYRDTCCLLLLDDLSSKKKLVNSEQMVVFACNCRHNRITLLICVQYFNHVKPDIRTNCDFFMTNSERSDTTAKKMFTEVFSMFPDQRTFKKALKFYTENYGSLVWFNGGGNRQELEQCVFYYECVQKPLLDKEGKQVYDDEGKPKTTRIRGDDFTLECRITDFLGKLFAKTDAQVQEEMRRQSMAIFEQRKREWTLATSGKAGTSKTGGAINLDKLANGAEIRTRGKHASIFQEFDDDDDDEEALNEDELLQERENEEYERARKSKSRKKKSESDDEDDDRSGELSPLYKKLPVAAVKLPKRAAANRKKNDAMITKSGNTVYMFTRR